MEVEMDDLSVSSPLTTDDGDVALPALEYDLELTDEDYVALETRLGSRQGRLNIAFEFYSLLAMLVLQVGGVTLMGLLYGAVYAGGLVFICFVLIPFKWIFIFYFLQQDKDASFEIMVRLYVYGIMAAMIPQILQAWCASFLEQVGPQIGVLLQYFLQSLLMIVLAIVDITLISLPLILLMRRSGHWYNKYSGYLYAMSCALGYGALVSSSAILRFYIVYFEKFSLPYMLWLLAHLFAMSVRMGAAVYVGAMMGERKFRRSSSTPIPSWIEVYLPPTLFLAAFYVATRAIPPVTLRILKTQFALSNTAIGVAGLWSYVYQDAIGMVFMVFVTVNLAMGRARVFQELNDAVKEMKLSLVQTVSMSDMDMNDIDETVEKLRRQYESDL